MQELTRVVTVEITEITKISDGCYKGKEMAEKLKPKAEEELKNALKVDNVVITNIQDFVRDIDTDNKRTAKTWKSKLKEKFERVF